MLGILEPVAHEHAGVECAEQPGNGSAVSVGCCHWDLRKRAGRGCE
jgi:hypothetical protein